MKYNLTGLRAKGFATALLASAVLTAQGANWTGAAGDGNWFNPLNWDTGTVPNAELAKIDGDYVVNYDGQDSSLTDIGFDLGTINISNGIITGSQTGDTILAGRTSGSTYVNIKDGGGIVFSNNRMFLIGHDVNSRGYVTVEEGGLLQAKTNGTNNNQGLIHVGNNGYGQLDVTGGTVKSTNLRIGNQTGSVGVLNLSSGAISASRTVHVGNIGSNGTLNMTGGTMNSWYLYLASQASGSVTSKGTVNLSGGTITASLGTTIGGEGTAGESLENMNHGEFNISGAGTINTGTVYMGKNSYSSGVINATGGSFIATSIYAGYVANSFGTINVYDGANIQAGNIYLGRSGGKGLLDIKGTSFSLTLKNGTGLAAIKGGNATGLGTVRFSHSGNLVFANKIEGAGTNVERLAGGVTTLTGANAHAAGTDVKGGQLIVSNATALGTGKLSITGGTVNTTETAISTGSVDLSGGRLDLADGFATVFTLTSDFTVSGGFYEIDILSLGEFDKIVGNSGNVNLIGGTLVLDGFSGFEGDLATFQGNRYHIFQGFNPVTDVAIIIDGYDDANWTASIDADGYLVFEAVPEPATVAAIIGALALGIAAYRKRK